MPELPEVESLRRSLVPKLIGQKILSIRITKPKLVSDKGTKRLESQDKVSEFISELTDQTIQSIDRIAKNLIFRMASGRIMLVHLKMTGQLVYQSNIYGEKVTLGGHPIELSTIELPNKHSHIIFELEKGTLYFNDTRMFGYLLYYPDQDSLNESKHFDKLGLDPLSAEFKNQYFNQQFSKLSGTVKKNFLEQNVVVGLGNIYADEVCFEAGIRPTRTNKSLKDYELDSLFNSINKIMPNAVDQGGSSVANYLLGDGSKGNYASFHKVYKRGGLNCLVCNSILTSIKHSGRTTVFCPSCQI